MRKVFEDLGDDSQFVAVYFDNIYVSTSSWEEHLRIMRLVLERLKLHGLTARPSKCRIGYPEVKYLGFTLGNGSVSPSLDKVSAISDMKPPSTKKQLRSFLGLVGFYRKFVPHFSEMSAPLTGLLRKDSKEPLSWSPEHERCFESLKGKLVESPILALPDLSKTFCLRTDASNKALGAVLFQYVNSVPQPVSYASRKLLDREVNYATVEKECLAIVWAIDKFKYYLFGREFILETDHRPLQYLQSSRGKNSRLTRWSLALQTYKFNVSHVPGPWG